MKSSCLHPTLLFHIHNYRSCDKLFFFFSIFLYHKILQNKVQNVAKYYNDAKFFMCINYDIVI